MDTAPAPTAAPATGPAHRLLAGVQALVGGRRLRSACAAVAALLAAAALGLVLLDALLALPEPLRVPALPLVLAGAALALLAVVALAARLRPDPAAATRLAEAAAGDRLRLLATALALEGMPGELAAAGAARLAAALPGPALAAALPRGGARRWLLAVAGVALAAGLLHLALPTLYPSVVPRFLDPRGDHPPFSLTGLRWAAAPERVRAGDSARFEVDVDNLTPAVARGLVLRSDAGARVPLFQVGAARFAAELAGLEQPLTAWVEGGGTRTPYHRLAIDPVPVLAHLDLALLAPDYAHLEPERRRVLPGEQARWDALPGSRLRLVPAANRPLAALLVQRDDGAPQRLALQGGAAELADLQPGLYSVAAEAVDGIRGHAQAALRVDARTDQPPHARIAAPGRDALATPGMRIPLLLEADDDLGLVEVLKVGEYDQLAAPELRRRVSGRTWRDEGELDLAALGVAPGDLLTITLVARDTRPPHGQLSEAATRTITIISEEDYNRELLRRVRSDALERKYQPLARELAALEKRMAELKKAAPPPDALARELAALGAKAAALERRVQALRREKPLFAVEPALQKQLEDAARALAAAAAAGDPARAGDGSVGAMLEHDLALLTRLARMQGLAARLRQLIDAEQNTVERLAPLAEHRRLGDAERVRLRELGDQEQELAEAIEQWLGLAPKLAFELRHPPAAEDAKPDPTGQAAASRAADEADEVARALDASGAADLKRKAAAAARAGDGREAQRLAAEARDRLLALLPRSNRLGGTCSGEACLRIAWGDCQGMAQTLGCLGAGLGDGYGLGGVGAAGLGLFLGYGGDDQGGSRPSGNLDLYGPENLGDLGGGHDDNGHDGIAALAAGGGAPPRQAAAYRQALRTTTGAARAALSADEQRLIDAYYRQLDAGEKP